jgi:hypothetical protein
MTSNAGKSTTSDHRRHKKPKSEDVGIILSAEIRALQGDTELHPYSESTPRQEPAMTRDRGAPPRETQGPKEKRHHRRGLKKREGATSMTKPEVPPLTEPKGVAILTSSEIPAPLTGPKVPATRSWSEVTPLRTQPEVIDLTKDD